MGVNAIVFLNKMTGFFGDPRLTSSKKGRIVDLLWIDKRQRFQNGKGLQVYQP